MHVFELFDSSLFLCHAQIEIGYKIPKVSVTTLSRKSIAKSLFHGSRYAVFNHCFKNDTLSKLIVNEVGRIVQQEIAKLCSLRSNSILHLHVQSFESFSWNSLFAEFQKYAPVLQSLLMSATKSKRNQNTKPEIIVGTILAMLCKYRCSSMSLLQKFLSVCLYANHTSKQVIINDKFSLVFFILNLTYCFYHIYRHSLGCRNLCFVCLIKL